jgi:hypothetical protein
MKMRMGVAALAAVGTLLGVTGCAGPQERAARDVRAAAPETAQQWKGVVLQVEPQVNAIAIRSAEDTQVPAAWFALAPDTIMTRDGERVSLMELREGTPVRVSFAPAVGPERAYRVEVLTGEEGQEVLQQAQQRMQQHQMMEPGE